MQDNTKSVHFLGFCWKKCATHPDRDASTASSVHLCIIHNMPINTETGILPLLFVRLVLECACKRAQWILKMILKLSFYGGKTA